MVKMSDVRKEFEAREPPIITKPKKKKKKKKSSKKKTSKPKPPILPPEPEEIIVTTPAIAEVFLNDSTEVIIEPEPTENEKPSEQVEEELLESVSKEAKIEQLKARLKELEENE